MTAIVIIILILLAVWRILSPTKEYKQALKDHQTKEQQ